MPVITEVSQIRSAWCFVSTHLWRRGGLGSYPTKSGTLAGHLTASHAHQVCNSSCLPLPVTLPVALHGDQDLGLQRSFACSFVSTYTRSFASLCPIVNTAPQRNDAVIHCDGAFVPCSCCGCFDVDAAGSAVDRQEPVPECVVGQCERRAME